MDSIDSLQLFKGDPYPFGISLSDNGVNFSLPSKQAKEVILCLYNRITQQSVKEISLNPAHHKTGNVWHIQIQGLPSNLAYAYKILSHEDRQSLWEKEQSLFNWKTTPINDPYAKSMATGHLWGKPENKGNSYKPLSDIYILESFDWGEDAPPAIPKHHLIIYEMHVRGYTRDPSSQTTYPGTFLGIIEKIPHLLEMGVNAVELLPIQEFDELDNPRINPKTKEHLFNYWGYSTVNFFSPMNRYAATDEPGTAIKEFKRMVKELHRHNIEVFLDVVFNHTAEGGIEGSMLSFKGIDDAKFYLFDANGDYSNYSGCGNSVNANQPSVLEFIISCLRYWVIEMHVDGFRFDLASALTRDSNGKPMSHAPLIAAISSDPILAHVKLISEPWDAAGLYQVGSFAPETKRWSEWNGKYRDSIRRFIKGSMGANGEFAVRLCGSEDLYHVRTPLSSVNFITAHDGFTLKDLVSYNEKHNIQNGEGNRDGTNDNESWNCGIEGDTSNPKICALRERQMRNFHLALMVSQGIPMLHMGDEYGHTKNGNNNSWCEDSPLNWFLWEKLQTEQGFYRYYRKLIHFRKSQPIFQRTTFLTPKDVDWHGLEPLRPDWGGGCRFVAFTLKDHIAHRDMYIAFNAYDVAVSVHVPNPPKERSWHWIVNTSNSSPMDIYDPDEAPVVEGVIYKMSAHSAIMFQAW